MKRFFAPNISGWGRLLRVAIGLALVAAGLLVSGSHLWICLALAVSGAFSLFEALRGWCLLRACGVRTRV